MSRAPLSRDAIVDATVRLLADAGPDALTMRGLGAALGTDPTAVYRHFRDKEELVRAVSERLLADVTAGLPDDVAGWRHVVTAVCTRLRDALLRRPYLSSAVQSAPPLQPGEFAITEVLLRQFERAGLDETRAALAYHAVIELSVGSAAIDAAVAALGDADRERTYARWRAVYAALDPTAHPSSVAAAPHLYRGSAEDRFRHALEALLDGLTASRPG